MEAIKIRSNDDSMRLDNLCEKVQTLDTRTAGHSIKIEDDNTKMKELSSELSKLREQNETLEKALDDQKQAMTDQGYALAQQMQDEIANLKAKICDVEKQRTVLKLTAEVIQQPDTIHIGITSMFYLFRL